MNYKRQVNNIIGRLLKLSKHSLHKAKAVVRKIPPKVAIITLIAIPVAVIWGMVIYRYVTTPRPAKIKVLASSDGYYFGGQNSIYSAKFGDKETNEPKIEFSLRNQKDKSITISPASARADLSAPKMESDKVIFTDVYQNTDFIYQTVPLGVKEDIVVNSPNGISTYPFYIESNGLVPQYFAENLAGGVFYDVDKNYLFHFEKPFAVDALGNRTDNVGITIRKDIKKDKLVALLNVDKEWLKSPSRAYPITIDPTIIHDESSEFATGTFNRNIDTGSGSSPSIETYYQELPADEYTVGLWHMDEGTADTCTGGTNDVCDSSGNGLDGAFSGNTTFTTDSKIGPSATIYDGVSGQVTIADDDKLSFTDKKFTIEAWVKRNGNPAAIEYIVLKGVAVWEYTMRIATTGLVQTVIWGSGSGTSIGSVSSTKTVTDGQWHHVAMVVDGSYSYIYIDGELDGSVAVVGTLSNTTASLYFGDRSDVANSELEGSIDNVRISNINRSAEEIKAAASRRPSSVYTSEVLDLGLVTAWNDLSWTELGVTTGDGETLYDNTGLVAQWNFNETSGTTATNNAGSCGATCDGTLTNFASTASQDQSAGTGWTANNRRWGAGALMFDGTNDKVDVSDHTSLRMTSGGTITAWIRPSSLGGNSVGRIVDKSTTASATNGYMLLLGSSNSISFRVNVGTSTVSYSNAIKLGEWNHVAVVFDGTGRQLYVNGVDVTASGGSETGLPPDVAGTVSIGNRAGATDRTFDGVIDSTSIYARTLTSSEILSNYQAGQIELQTRVGNTTTPDDGSWEAWRPVTGETQILTMDSDQSDWVWDNSSTYVPKTQSNDANIKVQGSGSLKQTVGQPQVDGNTVGLWHLDETGGTGAYIKDSSGNANHGTPTGTSLAQGISGKARNFNGTSQYITVPAGAGSPLDIDTNPVTMEAWINPDSITGEQHIVSRGTRGVEGYGLAINVSSGLVNLGIHGGGNFNGTTVLSPGTWYHIVGIINGTSSAIYVNGKLDATGTVNVTASNLNLHIGSSWNGSAEANFFDGSIDEVRISNTARTAEEIAESYRAGRDHYINRTFSSTDLSGKTTLPFYVAADRPGSYLQASIGETPYSVGQPDANTVGFWRLDEQTGTGAYLKDSSGGGFHGTPTNTSPIEGKIGKARYFNGTSDYINAGTSSSLDFSTSFTIDAWIYRSTTQNSADSAIVSKMGNSGAAYPGYMLFYNSDTVDLYINGGNRANSTTTIPANTWTHVTGVWTGTLAQIYINGVLSVSSAYSTAPNSSGQPLYIGRYDSILTRMFTGSIDEVRVSNTARTADEIRQAYEYGLGLRSHPITIDFGASLDAGNLVSNSGDLSFTVDATVYGLSAKGSKLFVGDKVIVRENYDGTEYLAQGTVTGVTPSTGAVTVASWDSGSTFPSGGYTAGASVFKWQREYWNHRGSVLDSHIDGITQLSLRLTDGNEGRTIYLDDFKSSGGYLTTPTGSSITSSLGERYFQYRAVLSSSDETVSPQLSMVTVNYDINVAPNTPSLDAPPNTAINQPLTPSLLTTATDDDGDYLRYKIELCEDEAMTSNCQTFDQTSSQTGWSGQDAETGTAYASGTQATYTIQTPLDPSTTYYWRSYAIDPGGINIFSDTQGTPYSFTTSATPNTPSLDSPANTATNQALTPILRTTATDPDSDYIRYKIEICEDVGMTSNCQTFDQTSSQTGWSGQDAETGTAYASGSQGIFTVQTPLSSATTYYWRSYAIDPGGSNTFGSTQGTPYSFTTAYAPSAPTSLLTQGATNPISVASSTPYFSAICNDPDAGDTLNMYQIQVDNNSDFSSPVWDSGSSGTSMTDCLVGQRSQDITFGGSPLLFDETTYYWRIKFWDELGNEGVFSTENAYFIMTGATVGPSNCRIQEGPNDSSLTFLWDDNSTDEERFRIERNLNNGGFTFLANTLADVTSYPDNDVSQGNTYQYRVRSELDPNFSEWCTTVTVSIEEGTFMFQGVNLRGININ